MGDLPEFPESSWTRPHRNLSLVHCAREIGFVNSGSRLLPILVAVASFMTEVRISVCAVTREELQNGCYCDAPSFAAINIIVTVDPLQTVSVFEDKADIAVLKTVLLAGMILLRRRPSSLMNCPNSLLQLLRKAPTVTCSSKCLQQKPSPVSPVRDTVGVGVTIYVTISCNVSTAVFFSGKSREEFSGYCIKFFVGR